MNTGKFLYLFFVLFISIGIIYWLVLFVGDKEIFATQDLGQQIDKISIPADFDSDSKKIDVYTYKKDGEYSFYAKTGSALTGRKVIKLSGFEQDVTFCQPEIISLSSGNKAVCVRGFVGAHSENIEILAINENNIKTVSFNKNNFKSSHNFSDTPGFNFIDTDGKISGIYLDYRNYDLDPLVDTIRSYYYLREGSFYFDHSENIKLTAPDNSRAGKII